MAYKQLFFRAEAREKIVRGAAALADAVRVTLGPKSKCVLIGKKWGRPIVCNDGVTIAKEIEIKDGEENLGAQMMREAAERTGDVVGDGTTTSTILGYAMLAEGARNVAAGASAIDLKRGIDSGVKAAIEALRAISRPVEGKCAQVAATSAHNDSTIGELVATAMEKVGPEGATSVEEAKGMETTLYERRFCYGNHSQPGDDAWCGNDFSCCHARTSGQDNARSQRRHSSGDRQ